ncbi:MAG: hypothetical protein OSJ38_12935, partial [Lachnospiraceae bacterium]|nr:hypothetical protein [Lachnospiraceae bacterium]
MARGGAATATTCIRPYKQAAGLSAVQTMEERFAYGLTPKKLGAVERGALFFQIRQAFPHGFPLLSVSEHEKTPQ